eukprot:CAMPEP_0197034430 /NCGR_PEP_ID=MMETSP1384-20130603/12558_1 /TAXON_ID=29189 /ORGANISM="Ammonia sp." /LENGTH=938 /DNA_ID=CAMNT_0042464365 /DNA_START=153 /DNA_END=2969 /DNA_ORIENTATION=-
MNAIGNFLSGGKKKNKKTNQKLGIDIPGMVDKFMQPQMSGFVPKDEYNYFWLAMQNDSPEVNVYIHLLVQHLLDHMSKNTKLPFDPQVLLNTISFLVLRHPTQAPSKQVDKILKEWFKNRQKYSDLALPAAKDVLGVLYKQRVEQRNGLDSLIIQCYQFYSHDELSRIADYYENPTILDVVGGIENIGASSGDKVCIWPYLKELASRDPDNFKLVIQNTITKLRGIGGQILLSPKLAEISLLALIFMMNQLISSTRVPDEQWLNKCISNLKRFYLWPVPYGSQARDLLIKLQKERVAPGFALIQKIWRECRVPEIILLSEVSSPRLGSKKKSDFESPEEEEDEEDEFTEESSFRPLYYLFDIDDSKSLLFANVMKIDAESDWGSNYKIHSGPSAFISAVLILNIISYDCGKSDELENAIKKLNENEINIFYKQVMDIFTSSANSSDSKLATESRRLGLKEIETQIIDHANEKDDDDIDDECVLYTEDIHVLQSTDYRVELPVLHHTGIGCDLKHKIFPTPGQMASNEMLYPSNEVLKRLKELMENLYSLATEDEKVTLRFMIAGGNSILSAVATAYAGLMRHAQPMLVNFNIEFFILPYSRNHYAEWLARQDPWYNRHIYLPLECRLFVTPSLLPDTKAKLRSHGHLHTVGQFYREMSESYAREADQLVKLRLWEVLCWENPPYTKTPHQLIPFCQRVEFGKVVEKKAQDEMYKQYGTSQIHRNRANTAFPTAAAQQGIPPEYADYAEDIAAYGGDEAAANGFGSESMKPDAFMNGDYQEYKYDPDEAAEDMELFDYQPIPLDIEWQPVDMLGRAQHISIDQKSQYLDCLSISSVPRYGDKGFPASPDKSGVIHMYCKVMETTKKKKYQEYALLKTEPSQHVRTCVCSAANNSSDRFFVMVDDQIYGKFSRIKIQPMIDPVTKDQVFMPIRTFFPVNV